MFCLRHPKSFLITFLDTVQVVNGTNTTMTYYEREKLEQDKREQESTTTEYLIPRKLVFRMQPSLQSNETVPFPIQPELQLYDVLDRWVQNVGTKLAPWRVSASLVAGHGDPEARLEGRLEAPFVNGTANFSDLAITHNGTYFILYNVTYPSTVSFTVKHGPCTIKERKLGFNFTYNATAQVYESLPIMPQPSVTVFDEATGERVDTGWKKRDWFVKGEILPSSNINNVASIYGESIHTIVNGTGHISNFSIDTVGSYQIVWTVYTDPPSSYNHQHVTPSITVKERQIYAHVAQQMGDCNDTVVCGQQPLIEIRSVAPDMIAANVNSKGRRWFVNASLCKPNNNNNPLLGRTRFELSYASSSVQYQDLHFDYVALNQEICFEITVEPASPKHVNITTKTEKFDVVKRLMYLAVNIQPDNANETIIFGQHPHIQVMDLGTQQPAHPLREAWDVTVAIETNPNKGILSGTKTVTVNGTAAVFKDIAITTFGVGYVLKFTSNHGNEVSYL